MLFTENETNFAKLWGRKNESTYVKDALHERIVESRVDAVIGTWYRFRNVPSRQSVVVRFKSTNKIPNDGDFDEAEFDDVIAKRKSEALVRFVLPSKDGSYCRMARISPMTARRKWTLLFRFAPLPLSLPFTLLRWRVGRWLSIGIGGSIVDGMGKALQEELGGGAFFGTDA
jgi:hypothetical protein